MQFHISGVEPFRRARCPSAAGPRERPTRITSKKVGLGRSPSVPRTTGGSGNGASGGGDAGTSLVCTVAVRLGLRILCSKFLLLFHSFMLQKITDYALIPPYYARKIHTAMWQLEEPG